MAGAFIRKRLPLPAAPSLAKSQVGERGHQIHLGRPNIAISYGLKFNAMLGGEADSTAESLLHRGVVKNGIDNKLGISRLCHPEEAPFRNSIEFRDGSLNPYHTVIPEMTGCGRDA